MDVMGENGQVNNGENVNTGDQNGSEAPNKEKKEGFLTKVKNKANGWLDYQDNRTRKQKFIDLGKKVGMVGAVLGAFVLGSKVAEAARDQQDALLLEGNNEPEPENNEPEPIETTFEDEVTDYVEGE